MQRYFLLIFWAEPGYDTRQEGLGMSCHGNEKNVFIAMNRNLGGNIFTVQQLQLILDMAVL